MQKLSFRTILVCSLADLMAGMILLGHMSVDTPRTAVIVYMAIIGLGIGAVYPTLGNAAASSVDWNHRGVAVSSSQFLRSIGGMIGVSLLGTVLTRKMASGMAELDKQFAAVPADQLRRLTNPQTLVDTGLRESLPHDALLGLQNVFSDALNQVFAVGAVFVGIGLLATILMGKARFVQPVAGKEK